MLLHFWFQNFDEISTIKKTPLNSINMISNLAIQNLFQSLSNFRVFETIMWQDDNRQGKKNMGKKDILLNHEFL
jgi:hypothetical protein